SGFLLKKQRFPSAAGSPSAKSLNRPSNGGARTVRSSWFERFRERGMPDRRQHRGPHPDDRRLFSSEQAPALRMAVEHLSWLLTRGYAPPSALKLVGDRFSLLERQRIAVLRCSCGDDALHRRERRRVDPSEL